MISRRLPLVLLLTACVDRPSAPPAPTERRAPIHEFVGEIDLAEGTMKIQDASTGRGLFGELTVEQNGSPGLVEPDRVELVTLSVGECAGPNTFGGEVQINASYAILTDLFVQITSITPAVGFGPNALFNDRLPPFDNSRGLWVYAGGPGTTETWCFDTIGASRFVFRGRVMGDTSTALPESSPWQACGPRRWEVATRGGSECQCQPRFTGASCELCAPGYQGADCTECAAGFVASDRLGGGFDPDPSDPRSKSFASAAWELRCEPVLTRDCAALSCGPNGACDPGDGYAVCVCAPGSTGADCGACAPGYERDALGGCVLGADCRRALCNDAGACVAGDDGAISCACDDPMASPLGCGAPEPVMLDEAGQPTEWRSLYPGEGVQLDLPLDATGGTAQLRVRSGPARVEPCDRSCAPGADVRLVAETASMGGLSFVAVSVGDPMGLELDFDLAIVPPEYVPITGYVNEDFRPIYDNILWFMKARGMRALAIGISKGGVTVAKNGFGYRDLGLDADPWSHEGEGGPLVFPSTPFRIASLTKPITAAAVRDAAADAGVNIGLGTVGHRAAELIGASTGLNPIGAPVPFQYSTGASSDARWSTLTIRQLINHNAGYVRDAAHAPTANVTNLATALLPNTGGVPMAPNPSTLQTDLSPFNASFDVFFSLNLYAPAALAGLGDRRVTFDKMVRVGNAVAFDYNPGGATQGDNYSNYGYGLLGRVLEGLRGETYDPDEPGVPFAAGPYPYLVREFLCPLGIPDAQFFPGDGRGRAGEPAYRELDTNGQALLNAWDIADPRRLRFVPNMNGGFYQACTLADPDDCDPMSGMGWTTGPNARPAEGGIAMGALAPVGGWVSTVDAYLKFARRYQTSVGRPSDVNIGTGSPLAGVAAYPPGSSHNGSLPGTWTWIWQMAGTVAQITMPQPNAAWSETLPANAPVDFNGAVVVNENLNPAQGCMLPSDVAVAVFMNARTDYRAPVGAISGASNSSNANVYGRIRDFVFDGICEIDQANAWPAQPPLGVLGQPLMCP